MTEINSFNREKIVAVRSGCDVGRRPMRWGGKELYPVEVYLRDGRVRTQFQDAHTHRPSSDDSAPRISYNYAVRGQRGTRVSGLLVPPHMRRAGLGGKMLDWLVEELEGTRAPVIGSHRINKPLTALLLARHGFVPDSNLSIAEIVNSGQDGESPTIKWLHNVRGSRSTVSDCSYHGSFYNVAGAAAVDGYEEPSDPRHVVYLHTTFTRE